MTRPLPFVFRSRSRWGQVIEKSGEEQPFSHKQSGLLYGSFFHKLKLANPAIIFISEKIWPTAFTFLLRYLKPILTNVWRQLFKVLSISTFLLYYFLQRISNLLSLCSIISVFLSPTHFIGLLPHLFLDSLGFTYCTITMSEISKSLPNTTTKVWECQTSKLTKWKGGGPVSEVLAVNFYARQPLFLL